MNRWVNTTLKKSNNTIKMNGSQLATVLAALRFFQEEMMGGGKPIESVRHYGHFDEYPCLDAEEIDRLCEDLNSGDALGTSPRFIVCEVILQVPSVSWHTMEEAALEHAVSCAMENLCPEDCEDKDDCRDGFRAQLSTDGSIREGDYEVYILTPDNQPA